MLPYLGSVSLDDLKYHRQIWMVRVSLMMTVYYCFGILFENVSVTCALLGVALWQNYASKSERRTMVWKERDEFLISATDLVAWNTIMVAFCYSALCENAERVNVQMYFKMNDIWYCCDYYYERMRGGSHKVLDVQSCLNDPLHFKEALEIKDLPKANAGQQGGLKQGPPQDTWIGTFSGYVTRLANEKCQYQACMHEKQHILLRWMRSRTIMYCWSSRIARRPFVNCRTSVSNGVTESKIDVCVWISTQCT